MHARIAKEEMSLLFATPRNAAAEQVEALRLAAGRAHDAAVVGGVRGFFARLGQALGDWNARRAAEAELRSLNDRQLADLGLTRADIPFAIRRGR